MRFSAPTRGSFKQPPQSRSFVLRSAIQNEGKHTHQYHAIGGRVSFVLSLQFFCFDRLILICIRQSYLNSLLEEHAESRYGELSAGWSRAWTPLPGIKPGRKSCGSGHSYSEAYK